MGMELDKKRWLRLQAQTGKGCSPHILLSQQLVGFENTTEACCRRTTFLCSLLVCFQRFEYLLGWTSQYAEKAERLVASVLPDLETVSHL